MKKITLAIALLFVAANNVPREAAAQVIVTDPVLENYSLIKYLNEIDRIKRELDNYLSYNTGSWTNISGDLNRMFNITKNLDPKLVGPAMRAELQAQLRADLVNMNRLQTRADSATGVNTRAQVANEMLMQMSSQLARLQAYKLSQDQNDADALQSAVSAYNTKL